MKSPNAEKAGASIDISIVIVNWNAKRCLLQCLRSIAETTGGLRTETIVVDNGSSDDSVISIKKDFPWVIVIENGENLGFAKANNIGIRESVGAYVCLVNSDVVVIEKCFQTLFEYLEKHSRVGIIGPKMLGPDWDARRSTMGFPTLANVLYRALALDSLFLNSRVLESYLGSQRKLKSIREVDVLNGFFWMVRREALRDVGTLDERFFLYGEDIDFCIRMRAHGWSRVYHPGSMAIHFGGASSARQPVRFYVEMQKANLQCWRKHHSLTSSTVYLGIMLLHHSVRLLDYAFTTVFFGEPGIECKHKMGRSREALRWFLAGLFWRKNRQTREMS